MKIIYPTTDLSFKVVFYDADNNIINLSQVSSATIKLFTDNEEKAAVFTKADIDASSNLYVDSSTLRKLRNGVMLYKYTVVFHDPNFPDKNYTNSDVYQTNMYLQNFGDRPDCHKPTTATCVSELYNDADYITKQWAIKNFHTDGVAYATEEYVDNADASIREELNQKADSSTTYTKTQANNLFLTADDASTLVVQIINDMDLPQGLQGTQGYMGTQGYVGTQGAVGTSGEQGAKGTQGEQGTQGYIGTQGNVGAQGAIGTQGERGTQGYEGPQGVAGTPGSQGIAGTPGEQGTQGYMGTQGERGTQGYEGPQGQPGPDGNPGIDGNPGSDGQQGPIGTQGYIGTQGEQGTVGTQGEQGTQGFIGTQGYQGAQGEPGPASTDFYTKDEIDAKYSNEWYGTLAEYQALSPNYDASTNYYILVS